MANMPGFDLIFELSPRALVELIRPQLMLNGVNYDPPAEISQTVAGVGRIHLVLTDLSVAVRPNAGISISFAFERGSLTDRPAGRDLFGVFHERSSDDESGQIRRGGPQTMLEHAAMLYGPSMLTYMDLSPDVVATIFPPQDKLDQK